MDSNADMAARSNRLTAIVAIDLRGAIGCRNALPWRLRSDMKFFRETTTGHTVVMGRKTYDSIGGCLPKRHNVVLSHNNVLFQSSSDCQLALSVPEALFRIDKFADREAFVVGGAVTYDQFAPLVDRYLVTLVDHEVSEADAYLTPSVMDSIRGWHRSELCSFSAEPGTDDYAFSVFEIVAPDAEERSQFRESLKDDFERQLPRPMRRRGTSNGQRFRPQEAFAF